MTKAVIAEVQHAVRLPRNKPNPDREVQKIFPEKVLSNFTA